MKALLFFLMMFLGLASGLANAAPLQSRAEMTTVTTVTFQERLRRLLPNTLTIDGSSDRTRVDLEDREPITGRNQPIGGSSNEAARLIGSLGLTRLPEHAQENYLWHFDWVPMFTFAYHNLQFESSSAFLSQSDFQLFRTSLGIGPEISYGTPIGRFSGSVTPGAAYSWVSWSSPVSGGAMARGNLNLALSLNYHRTLNRRWAVRAFVREVFEDTQVWNEALTSSQGFAVPVKRVGNEIIGLSLCFLFF